MIDVTAYLSRIGYRGPLAATAATLRGLQRAHLYSVPFENLDIHLGRPVDLSEAALFDKIVTRRRGGFCYEVNSLFARLLGALGFRVLLLSAEGANDDGTYSAPFDHLILQVHPPDDPETPWLVDVGWGDGPLEPLRLLEMGEQAVGGRVYRLRPETCYLVLEEKHAEGRWVRHYRFTFHSHDLADFAAMCRYHQTSPASMFTQKRLCSLSLPDGRVTLSELKRIRTREPGLRGSGEREERELSGEEEALRILAEDFGVRLESYPKKVQSP